MHRIVHFDLKGAPPKLPYLEQVLGRIKSWGTTGVLLEWEDTFPYSGNLAHLGSESNVGGDEMYSIDAVHHILTMCREMGLEVIQLVQTIGHMEFVLKHPCHQHLREYDRSPSIICPEKQESKDLVKQMVMQALAVQPDAKYFHIGADEVCHIAVCEDCRKRIKRTYPVDHWRIYLDHIRELALFIKEQRPNITILMWDDMLRTMTPEVLEDYRELSQMIQLVVWNYDVRDNFRFPPGMWVVYNRYFPTVWAGSAFKGANGSSQLISPVSRYVNNQVAWVNEIRIASSQVKFAGVVFTGWSRYDHFATLCELLPTAMNSLANCLRCFAVGTLENYTELHSDNTLPTHEWAGLAVAECVRRVANVHDGYLRLVCGDLRMTWLNRWQIDKGFLNLFQVDNIENFTQKLLIELKIQEEFATIQLCLMFGPRTCQEWLQTYVGTMEAGLTEVLHTIRSARRYDPRSSEYAFGGTHPTPEQGPSTTEQGPSTTEQGPSTTEQGPSTTEQGPSTTEQGPSTTEQGPSTTEQGPSATEQGLSTTDHSHSMVGQVPSMIGHILSSTSRSNEPVPLIVGENPSAVELVSSKIDDVP